MCHLLVYLKLAPYLCLTMQDNKTVSITFRTTKELKAALVLMAEKESRKLSNLIETLLDKAVKAQKKG